MSPRVRVLVLRVSVPPPFVLRLGGSRLPFPLLSLILCLLAFIARIGIARLAESQIRSVRGLGKDDKLTALDKIACSTIGGALATWNQPIEVSLASRYFCPSSSRTSYA